MRKSFLVVMMLLFVSAWFAAEAQEMMPMPKVGTEHEVLKKLAGVWDATVEAAMEPGKPPAVSKGVETNTLLGNGLWLVTDFKSEAMEQPFEGHGILGYDSGKKKYAGVWADSLSFAITYSWGTVDPMTGVYTEWMESSDASGKPMKMKGVAEWKDDNNRVWNAYAIGADGKETWMMKISYIRRP